jgi:hypothetical protein
MAGQSKKNRLEHFRLSKTTMMAACLSKKA